MSNGQGNPGRLHSLDALRGGCMFLGVLLHSVMSFIPADEFWLVRDDRPSGALAAVFFTIHIFRMTTFFVLAGFFARMSFHRLGAQGFMVDRVKRIAVPLVVAWIVLVPGLLTIDHWAMGYSYGPSIFQKWVGVTPEFTLFKLPLQHLWFLYLLSIFYVVTVIAAKLMARFDKKFTIARLAHRAFQALAQNPFAIFALALPAIIALDRFQNWTLWDAVPPPDRGLIPDRRVVLIYGVAFLFGWALQNRLALMEVWKRWWWAYLGLAVLITATCFDLAGVSPTRETADSNPAKLGEVTLYILGGWFWTFALIGISLRFLSGYSPARRYLADASYWVYLTHMPLVMVLQGAVSRLEWPAEIKLAVILGCTLVITLGSYQLFVRHSVIGAVLNGKRKRRGEIEAEAAAAAAALTATPPAVLPRP